MHIKKVVGISLAAVVGIVVVIGVIVAIGLSEDEPFLASYEANCASCHGFDLEGTERGVALLGPMQHGSTVAALVRDIATGAPDAHLPAFGQLLNPLEIKGIAIYIAERRVDQRFLDFRVHTPV